MDHQLRPHGTCCRRHSMAKLFILFLFYSLIFSLLGKRRSCGPTTPRFPTTEVPRRRRMSRHVTQVPPPHPAVEARRSHGHGTQVLATSPRTPTPSSYHATTHLGDHWMHSHSHSSCCPAILGHHPTTVCKTRHLATPPRHHITASRHIAPPHAAPPRCTIPPCRHAHATSPNMPAKPCLLPPPAALGHHPTLCISSCM